jgi:hypothetical protein
MQLVYTKMFNEILVFQNTVVDIYIPPVLTLKNCIFRPHDILSRASDYTWGLDW